MCTHLMLRMCPNLGSTQENCHQQCLNSHYLHHRDSFELSINLYSRNPNHILKDSQNNYHIQKHIGLGVCRHLYLDSKFPIHLLLAHIKSLTHICKYPRYKFPYSK